MFRKENEPQAIVMADYESLLVDISVKITEKLNVDPETIMKLCEKLIHIVTVVREYESTGTYPSRMKDMRHISPPPIKPLHKRT